MTARERDGSIAAMTMRFCRAEVRAANAWTLGAMADANLAELAGAPFQDMGLRPPD
jgi:hypothetical protein